VERWHPLPCASWRAIASLKNYFGPTDARWWFYGIFHTKLHLSAQQFREQPERCYITVPVVKADYNRNAVSVRLHHWLARLALKMPTMKAIHGY
jgi:hypothetical protein